MRRSIFLVTTWMVGTGAATCVAWLAVSSVITGVTAASRGPVVRPAGLALGARPALATHASRKPAVLTPAAPAGTVPTTAARGVPPTTAAAHTHQVAWTTTTRRTPAAPLPPTTPVTSPEGVAPTPSASPSASTTTTSSPLSQTFGSRGGVVTVSCNGTAIQLVSASPGNGYTMQVDSPGPTDVSVRFSSSERESRIYANCQNGTPVGQVYEDS